MTTLESSRNRLRDVLFRWDNRLRVQHSARWAPRGLAIGLATGLVVAIAARLLPLLPVPIVALVGALLGAIGLLVALLAVWLWRRAPLAIARRFDRLFDLRERTSTALELATGRLPIQSEAMAHTQVGDALQIARGVDPRRLKVRIDWRDFGLALAVAGALAVALLLPNPQSEALAERRAVREAVEEQVEELEALRQEVAQDPTLSEEERQQILETLDETIEALEQRGISREEAVAELAAAEQRLRDISREAGRQRMEALQQAGASFDSSAASQALGEALEQGDLEAASEVIESMLDPEGEPLTREEELALAEDLAEAAERLQSTNPELAEAFRQAAEAIQAGDIASARQALSQASEQMSQAAASGECCQTAEQAADAAQAGQGQVAQAGQGDGGGQAGESGRGSSDAGSDGERSGGGAGRGEGSGESLGGPESGEMPTDNAPGDGGERPYEEVFAPEHLGGEGDTRVDVPREDGDPGDEPVIEGEMGDNPAGRSVVPYNEVYSDYADAASQALESGHVPLNLRSVVRDYFSSLDPEQ